MCRSKPGRGFPSRVASRGAAFGDFDNDGDIDVVVNTVNDYPQLLRCDSKLDEQLDQGSHDRNEIEPQRNWRADRMRDPSSRRESKPHQQIDEVRSGGGYFSQNDLRVHFGLGKARRSMCWKFAGPAGRSIR